MAEFPQHRELVPRVETPTKKVTFDDAPVPRVVPTKASAIAGPQQPMALPKLTEGAQPQMPTSPETIHFTHRSEMPEGRKATCLNIMASHGPQKAEKERARFAVGRDRTDCKGKVSTPNAELTAVNLLLNSTISTEDAQLMTCDLNDFCLEIPMD